MSTRRVICRVLTYFSTSLLGYLQRETGDWCYRLIDRYNSKFWMLQEDMQSCQSLAPFSPALTLTLSWNALMCRPCDKMILTDLWDKYIIYCFFPLSQTVNRSLDYILPSRCKWRLCGDPDRSAPPVGWLQGVGPKQRGVVRRGGGPRLPDDPGPATPAWHRWDGSQDGTRDASGGGWSDGA